MNTDVGLMSLWRRFQEQARQAQSPSLRETLRTIYLDEVFGQVKGKPRWGLLALGETLEGRRHYLGATLTEERHLEAWEGFIEGLNLAEGGRGMTVVHDGDTAIAGAVRMVLPWAEERRCVGHEIHNVIRRARDGYPQARQREVIKIGIGELRANWPPSPRSISPIERRIKDLRRRIRPMDGFGSAKGAGNFLQAWLARENTRAQGRDWLEAFVA